MDYIGKVFQKTTVDLDGNTFQSCTFENCGLNYAGGAFVWKDCTLAGSIMWTYGGDLERGLVNLAAVYGIPVDNLLTAISSTLNAGPGGVLTADPV